MGNACCRNAGPDTQTLKEPDKDTDEPKQSKTKPNKSVKPAVKTAADVNNSHEDVNGSHENKGTDVNAAHEDQGADVNVKKTADYVNWDAIQEIQKEEEEEDSGEEEYVDTMDVNVPIKPDVIKPVLQTQRSTRSTRDEIYAPVSNSCPEWCIKRGL